MTIHLSLFICTVALFIVAMLWATVSDLKTRTIPNLASLLLLAAGVLNLFSGGFTTHRFIFAILGMVLGGFPLLVLALFKGTIGGGDIKLAGSAGFVLGGLLSYLALMVALFGFVIFGCFIRPKKERKEAPGLPFAPFYAAAALGALILPVLPSLIAVPIPILYL